MASATDFAASGRISAAQPDTVIFHPHGTTYELRLVTAGRYDGPLNERLQGLIRVTARKLYTVPSGGNFITPIAGPPRIVQGRIRYLDEQLLVVRAGTDVLVELPKTKEAYDLGEGPLAVGRMVNVVVLPGARFEWVKL